MKWTKAQSDAIYKRDKNILVSASAGSGKTAVLSERVLELLREGHDIDRFLIFTFTKASAKEMKSRIYKKILSEYKKSKDSHMKKQLEKINSANISTIHSFCMSVVKECFYTLDIPPRFNICTDVDEALIDSAVMDELLEENYKDATDSFKKVADYFEDRLDSALFSLARHLVQKIDFNDYIKEVEAFYKDDDKVKCILEDYLNSELTEVRSVIEGLINKAVGNEKLVSTLREDLLLLELIPGGDFSFPRLFSDKNLTEADKEIKEEVTIARTDYKKKISKLNSLDIDFEVESHRSNLGIVLELSRLATLFIERAFKARLDKSLISFSDLEVLTKNALDSDSVAEIYKNRFDFVFVDEYQDTSDIQEYIISRVTNGSNAFMVGDVKQSIYSFRQANPDIFIDKYNRYKNDDLSLRIDLNKNFRSSRFVLDTVNDVFDEVMTMSHGGLDYKSEARLEFGNDSLKSLNTKPKAVFISNDSESKVKSQYEYVASEVKRLVDSGSKYSDIVVLSRSLKSSVADASEVLRANGIPFYFDYSESYLDSLEVDIMLNYLRLIDNFRNDLAFLSVIRLPRYNFTDDEIYRVRLTDRTLPIYDTFISYNENDEIKEKIDYFISEIREFRRLEYELSLDELIQVIYKKTQFEKYIYLLDKPKQRLANIRLLFSIASEYESSTMVGLSTFLKFIEGIRNNKRDFSGANTISDKNDVLRIMSIHKSKGLEFDTVFLVGCEKKFNQLDFRDNYIFKDDYIELDYIDTENRVKKKSVVKGIVVDVLKDKLYAEELRLLYVALTRAVNRLYMVSSVKDTSEVKRYTLSESDSFFKYMSHIYLNDNIDKEFVSDTETAVTEINFDYDTEQRELLALDFDKVHRASKVSVTSIIHGKKSAMLSDTEVTNESMKKGSEFHKIMQWIDFDSDVETEFDRLISLGVIKDKSAIELVNTLINSKMYKLIEDSVKIERELEFIYKDEDIIQGVIDLVLHTEDGVLIVDYKTDKSLVGVEDYKEQLNYYSKAYEKVRSEKVVGKYLYLVRLDRLVKVD